MKRLTIHSIRSMSFRTAVRNLIVLLFVLYGASSFAQVTSSVDTLQIRIGEEIQYTIQVESDTTDIVVFPEGQTFLPLEVIESYKVDTTFDQAKTRLIKKYGLTQFDSGNYMIPAQRVFINERPFVTDSVLIEVADVPVDTTKQKMFDIKPALNVESPPFNFLKFLLWLIPIALILGGVGYYFFRRKKKKEEAEEKLPPYEEAIVALQALDSAELLKQDRSKEYYTSLTEIVKRYLDREVDDAALESTSDELITRLHMHRDAGHFEFDAETIQKLDSVLKRADLVKFAKMKQLEGQAQMDRSVVEEIINETHEIIPEPTEEELLENAAYLEELRKKKVRRQWILAVSGVFVLALLSGVVYGSINGFDNLKDHLLGNEIRDLSEGRWIRSEYGNPSVVIETPEVLVRKEGDTLNGAIGARDLDVFSYGDLQEPLYVKLSTIQFDEKQELELEPSLNKALDALEDGGAKNMIVKRESFETENGIKGIKAYGEFYVQVSENRVLKDPSGYELLLFAQQGGLQEVLIVYQNDERFAQGIKDRITNSVELEITEN